MARLCGKRHPRLMHVRALLLRLAALLDERKTLIRGARGVKLNYIRLIQVSGTRGKARSGADR